MPAQDPLTQIDGHLAVRRGMNQLAHRLQQPGAVRHGQAGLPQQMPEQIAGPGFSQTGHFSDGDALAAAGSLGIAGRQLFQERIGFGEMHRGPRQGLIAAGKTFPQQRKYFQAQVIAGMAKIGVAVIDDPFDAPCHGMPGKLLPRNLQQRADQPQAAAWRDGPPGRHAGRPVRTAAAQQVEQHGFDPVVALMGQRQPFGIDFRKGRVARLARRRFEAAALSGPDLDPSYFQRYLQRSAQAFAECLPLVGPGTQAMMDMPGREDEALTRRELPQEMQQHHRVEAAGEPDGEPVAALDMRRQAVGNPLRQISGRAVVP